MRLSNATAALLLAATACTTVIPPHSAVAGPNDGPAVQEQCRERGQLLAEIAKQRDRGLPQDAAVMIVRRFSSEGGRAETLIDPLYAPQVSRLSPLSISSVAIMGCVRQGVQRPFKPTTEAERELAGQMLAALRAGTDDPALGQDLMERQHGIESRLEATMPRRRANESEEDWRGQIVAIAEASLAPSRAKAAEMQRQEAERRERQAQQAEAQRQRAEREKQAAAARAEEQREQAEWDKREAEMRAQARAQYLSDNPEEAKRERLLAEQQRRQAELESQWYVLYREGVCAPISDLAPGARTPQEAVTYLRATRGVAIMADGQGDFATIQLPDGAARLTKGFKNCVLLRQYPSR